MDADLLKHITASQIFLLGRDFYPSDTKYNPAIMASHLGFTPILQKQASRWIGKMNYPHVPIYSMYIIASRTWV